MEKTQGCQKVVMRFFVLTVGLKKDNMWMLGNDKVILEKAKKYMGPKTTELQIEADGALGRK